MIRRGACPTVFAPLPSGDGLLARVKPPGGTLRPVATRALARAAAAHGNGIIELTSRANIQVRGLSTESTRHFAAAMVAAGLASADPAFERRRNVIVAPLADAATRRVAKELEAALADVSLARLPDKFGFVVDGGGGLPLDHISGDVRLRAGDGGWRVWSDGALTAAACDRTEAVGIAIMLAQAFLELSPPRGRMREAAPAIDLLPLAGIYPTALAPSPVPRPRCIGRLGRGLGVGLPFGSTDSATLQRLADVGTLWLTPWRSLVVVAARDVPEELGLITNSADGRLAVSACAGRPACASGHAATRDDAAQLAHMLPGLALHLSGCDKGCAHPGPAAITLVARPDGYAVVRDGRASDPPLRTGLALRDLTALLHP